MIIETQPRKAESTSSQMELKAPVVKTEVPPSKEVLEAQRSAEAEEARIKLAEAAQPAKFELSKPIQIVDSDVPADMKLAEYRAIKHPKKPSFGQKVKNFFHR